MNGVPCHLSKVNTRLTQKNEVYIYDWSEIAEQCGRTLILGNGASISVSSNFRYKSLKDCAIDIEKSESESVIKGLFDLFKTDDFELLLRRVWQAYKVNQILGIENKKVKDTYIRIRDSLIKAVRKIHPARREIANHLPKIAEFMRNFDYIISLNYDLIVYWAMMYANDQVGYDCPEFKDYFLDKDYARDELKFSNNWKNVTHRRKATLVFYPHGNLMLAKNIFGNEIKLSNYNESLLDDILAKWESEEYVPLFVSEGTSEQKISSIKQSPYLSTVYECVLINKLPYPVFVCISKKTGSFNYVDNKEKYGDKYKIPVIYGWSIGEQDKHILSQLVRYKFYETSMNSSCLSVAISVHNNNQKYCKDVIEIFESLDCIKDNISIYFFDSASAGCWNN